VSAKEFPDDFTLKERECYEALDLSSKRDLTAKAKVWPDGEGGFDAVVEFWTPADTLDERASSDRVPYRAWATAGHLEATPGRSLDYAYVAKSVAEDTGKFNVIALAFDQWRIEDFQRALDNSGVDSFIWEGPDKPDGEGLKLVRHAQGFGGGSSVSSLWMPRSIGALEELVLAGKLRVRFNPVLRWNSASAVMDTDATGNKKWEKRKSTGRIDGIVALSMAIGAASGIHAPAGEWGVATFSL
jgi:phage terminase large subunit-like protein